MNITPIQLKFPAQCELNQLLKSDLLCNFNNSFEATNNLITVDCSAIKFIRPFGLNLLSAILSLHLKNNNAVTYMPPLDNNVTNYMKDQGFYEEFSIQDSQITHSARSTSVALKRLDNVNGTYLENIASWLMHNGGIPENIAHDLVSISLLEVINNVFDHSLSPIGCYISAQAYHRKEQLILSILDLGIGFYQSLKQFYPEIRTDVDAIDKAVQEGVSSKKIIENKVRGVGLTNISGFIKNRGALHIISYNGTWYQDHSGKITTRSINCPLHGVCVNLSIDTKSMFELAEYGDEVWGE